MAHLVCTCMHMSIRTSRVLPTVENPLPSGLESVADTLTAGAPCVGYSVAGLQKGEEDPRDGIPAMLEAIKSVMPLTIELENVSNLQRHESVLENIVSTLKGLGYFVRVRQVDISPNNYVAATHITPIKSLCFPTSTKP